VEKTVDLIIKSVLESAQIAVASISTKLVENDRFFETTVVPAVSGDLDVTRRVLLGYHDRSYGTSVVIKGRTVISRQLNK
jgi:hypothetical protein